MKGALAIRKPTGDMASLDTSSTNVTSSAYVQLLASTSSPCSAVCVTNGGSQPMKLAVGGAGVEVDTGVIIPPAAYAILLPCEIAKSKRLSIKSLGGTQSSGFITISTYV